MKNIKKGFTVICLVLFVTMMFVRCDEGGEVEPENKGSVNFEMTDAPIDDANRAGNCQQQDEVPTNFNDSGRTTILKPASN